VEISEELKMNAQIILRVGGVTTLMGGIGAMMCLAYTVSNVFQFRMPLPLWPWGPAINAVWMMLVGASMLRRAAGPAPASAAASNGVQTRSVLVALYGQQTPGIEGRDDGAPKMREARVQLLSSNLFPKHELAR